MAGEFLVSRVTPAATEGPVRFLPSPRSHFSQLTNITQRSRRWAGCSIGKHLQPLKKKKKSMTVDLTCVGCRNSWPGWQLGTELHLFADCHIQRHCPLMLFSGTVPHMQTQQLTPNIAAPCSDTPDNHGDEDNFCAALSSTRPAPASHFH